MTQYNVTNKQVNSRGFGIKNFRVTSDNLIARKFEIKMLTIKFNEWDAVSLEEIHEEKKTIDYIYS